MQHLKAAGLRQRVVISQNKMPFFGKSGTPLIELATRFFLSSNSMMSALCCPDARIRRAGLDRLTAAEKVCGSAGQGAPLIAEVKADDTEQHDSMWRGEDSSVRCVRLELGSRSSFGVRFKEEDLTCSSGCKFFC